MDGNDNELLISEKKFSLMIYRVQGFCVLVWYGVFRLSMFTDVFSGLVNSILFQFLPFGLTAIVSLLVAFYSHANFVKFKKALLISVPATLIYTCLYIMGVYINEPSYFTEELISFFILYFVPIMIITVFINGTAIWLGAHSRSLFGFE